jgi:hypothetical protein
MIKEYMSDPTNPFVVEVCISHHSYRLTARTPINDEESARSASPTTCKNRIILRVLGRQISR